jgi:CDP-glucose 4,6-dehydratase
MEFRKSTLEIMVKDKLTYNYLAHHYRGKKVFITGHTGFKGTWLTKVLFDLGANIKGYALQPNTNPSLFVDIKGDTLCESFIHDIRDVETIKRAILEFKPDYIFHLAAQPLVRLSYEIPIDTFETNAIGTANLLEAVRGLENKCAVVLITTDKVYKNIESTHAYTETDQLGGYDPYSASKVCAEMIIDSYRNSFFNYSDYKNHGKSIAVARSGNVIGGGDWAFDRLLPDVVKALNANQEIVIRNPIAIRPWQHVIEPIMGYLELGVQLSNDPLCYGQAFNFGPDLLDNCTVEEVVKQSLKYWDKGNYRIDNSKGQPHEAGLLMLDIKKSLQFLNWKPVFNSAIAIERTINWYKSYFNRTPVIELMNADINLYYNKNNL